MTNLNPSRPSTVHVRWLIKAVAQFKTAALVGIGRRHMICRKWVDVASPTKRQYKSAGHHLSVQYLCIIPYDVILCLHTCVQYMYCDLVYCDCRAWCLACFLVLCLFPFSSFPVLFSLLSFLDYLSTSVSGSIWFCSSFSFLFSLGLS